MAGTVPLQGSPISIFPSSDPGGPFPPGTTILGRFRVEKLLGVGTFGWVYEASQLQGTERVALKVLKPEHAANDSTYRRFKSRELKALRRVQELQPTPHVVRALEPDLLEDRGYAMLVLEFVQGATLGEILARQRPLNIKEAREFTLGIARGLAAIHAADSAHRDLKPENIRIRGEDPVILDLGLAKAMWETKTLTNTNQPMMTPLYASPEQLLNNQDLIGAPSDVYALGLILFEMLVGSVPLSGDDYPALFSARATNRPPPDPRGMRPGIPDSLVHLVQRCLAYDPAQRPTSAELVQLLSTPSRSLQPPTPQTVFAVPSLRPEAQPSAQSARASRIRQVLVAVSLGGLIGTGAWVIPKEGCGGRDQGDAGPPDVLSADARDVAVPPDAPPPSPGLHLDLPARFKVGTPYSFSLKATTRMQVILLAEYEDKSGELFVPGAASPLATLEPGTSKYFPGDFVNTKLQPEPIGPGLNPGKKSEKERIVAIGFEDRPNLHEELSGLLPRNPEKAKRSPLRKEQLAALLAWASRAPGVVVASGDYEILAR